MIPSALHEPLMLACDGALERVLRAGATTRDAAGDLLAADAFVTWAFEAAADEPELISSRADDAMRRISARAVPFIAGEAATP